EFAAAMTARRPGKPARSRLASAWTRSARALTSYDKSVTDMQGYRCGAARETALAVPTAGDDLQPVPVRVVEVDPAAVVPRVELVRVSNERGVLSQCSVRESSSSGSTGLVT